MALLAAQGVTWMTTLVGVIAVPRFLGAERLGVYAAVATTTGLVAILAGCGTSNHLVKAVAREPQETRHLVAHAVVVRLLIWSVFFAVGCVAAVGLIDDHDASIVLVAMLISVGLGLVGGAATAGLQGNQMLGRASLAAAVVGLGSQGVVVFALAAGGRLVTLAMIGVATSAAATFVTLAIFCRQTRGPVSWSRPAAVSLLAAGLPFLAWEVALQLYGSVDYLLLIWLTDARTVGEYAFAYRLAGIPIFVPTVITGAVFPALAASARSDAAAFRTVLQQSVRIVLALTVPMAAGLIIIAPQLAHGLGGGTQFDDAVPLIVVLSLHIPLAALDTILGTALFASDRQRGMAAVAWVAALLNPLLNLLAIPFAVQHFDNGAVGASVITVLTECFMGAWIWVQLRADLGPRFSTTLLLSGACGVVMALAGLGLLRTTGPVGAFAVGLAAYCAAAIAFRLVTTEDARTLRGAVLGRLRPAAALS